MTDAAIFVDNSNGSFYTWGGGISGPSDPNFWRFDPDGKGHGKWIEVTPRESSDKFFKLQRSQVAAVASTNDAAFVFGGSVDSYTETMPDKTGETGYRLFNFTTQEWDELYGVPYSQDKTIYNGDAVFVPDFGPNGLIFILGGSRNISAFGTELDFRTLHMLDPVTQVWYKQETSGRVPSGRFAVCSAGVSTQDGRFDM
jgi:hypothetical protein